MPKIAAALVLLGAFVPIRADAQIPIAAPSTGGSTRSVDEVRKNYRIHAGPFYVDPALLIKELGVDTNVFNEAEDQKSDFTFTVTPQADIAVPLARRGLLRTTLGVDAVYYQKYDRERSINPLVTLRAEGYAQRLTLFAEGAYLNTRQRPNYEIDLRSRHQQDDASAGLAVRLSARTSLEAAVTRGRTRFDGDAVFYGTSLQTTLDRNTTGETAAFRHKLTALTTIATRYERLEERFPYSPVRNTDSYRVMPGVEFKPRALISGMAYVGYRHFVPLNGSLPAYSGLVSQVGLTYTLLGATTFGVTADRDITFSFEQLTPYFLDNSVGVFVRRAVGGRWDVMATAARHRYDYRSLAIETLAAVPRRNDVTDNYGLNLGYRLKKQTRVGFGATYYTRTSSVVTQRDYDGLRAGITVTYGF